jgi:hypothetical protein
LGSFWSGFALGSFGTRVSGRTGGTGEVRAEPAARLEAVDHALAIAAKRQEVRQEAFANLVEAQRVRRIHRVRHRADGIARAEHLVVDLDLKQDRGRRLEHAGVERLNLADACRQHAADHVDDLRLLVERHRLVAAVLDEPERHRDGLLHRRAVGVGEVRLEVDHVRANLAVRGQPNDA